MYRIRVHSAQTTPRRMIIGRYRDISEMRFLSDRIKATFHRLDSVFWIPESKSSLNI